MKDRTNGTAINPKYDRYLRGLPSLTYKLFDKKIGSRTKANMIEELASELHYPVTKKI